MERKRVMAFLTRRKIEAELVERMLVKCPALENAWDEKRAEANWAYLETRLGLAKRKIPTVVARCPQLLLVSVWGRLELMIISLEGVGAERKHLATMVASFPHTLLHSVEEKLCPLLAFLQDCGIKQQQLAKVLTQCPRLLSYSIDQKLKPTVAFFQALGLTKTDMGRMLTICPSLLGYNLESRLRPSVEFLKTIGIQDIQLQKLLTFFPNILIRKAEVTFKPILEHLHGVGFTSQQVTSIVAGYPQSSPEASPTRCSRSLSFWCTQWAGVCKRWWSFLPSLGAAFGRPLHHAIAFSVIMRLLAPLLPCWHAVVLNSISALVLENHFYLVQVLCSTHDPVSMISICGYVIVHSTCT